MTATDNALPDSDLDTSAQMEAPAAPAEGQVKSALTLQIKKVQVGQLEFYEFNGNLRGQNGGSFSLVISNTYSVFQDMQAKLNNNDFILLVEMCKKQIKATPTWYTPYLFIGIAYFKLGDRKSAKNILIFW